ncbi:MAG: NAD-glutamate dehydrogenase [Victivallaceae bacterium]|nr:NAD-glutamate dehydrogenase [Victivallaceae bacterium]
MKLNQDDMEGLAKQHAEKLKYWYDLLKEIMPDYFFKTFNSTQIARILPNLFNIDSQSGIQRIECENNIILIYLKSEENNLLVTSRMMRIHNIAGAVIHESKQKIVINNEPRTLVIEYYAVTSQLHLGGTPNISYKDLTAAYKKKFKKAEPELKEIYQRINWFGVSDLNAEKLAERLKWALDAQDKDVIKVGIEKVSGHELRLTLARTCAAQRGGFLYKLIEAVHLSGFNIERAYFRDLTRQDDIHAFTHMPVIVNTLYLTSDKDISLNSKKVTGLLRELKLVNWVDMLDLFHRELVTKLSFSLADTNLIRAVAEFIHTQLSFVDRSAYNSADIYRYMALYPSILSDMIALFYTKFDPEAKRNEKSYAKQVKKIGKEIDDINSGMHDKDTLVKTIFRSAFNFLQCIRKTNFFVENKTALAFRLDPSFMHFYSAFSEKYRNSFPQDDPYGVFYFFRENAIGFQVRFSEIARGGWRTVMPRNSGNELEQRDNYEFAKDEIFREGFVLAHTQHLKNKDIYEGGAKMITLLNLNEKKQFESALFESQRTIFDAFLSLINYDKNGKLNPQIIDYIGNKEIIEIGPDENMFDVMIEWMGNYAEKSGYTLKSGIISGKPDCGINHKEYGVTSFGVHQYLLKTLNELGITPEQDPFSVKISGGPFGDVAGNEIRLLLQKKNSEYIYPKLKIVAITDGPAALFDPEGIDREELSRLVLTANLDSFASEKLKGEGAYIVYTKPQKSEKSDRYLMICRHNGKLTEKMLSRDEFMKLFQNNLYNYADIFIPCGGRPSTIDISNWQDYCPGGKNSSRAIVEGANSFITPAARDKLQDAGIWIIKDASANKCGVITSSYEILSGLMLNPDEFKSVKKELVAEIMVKLRTHACREADWLFLQFKTSKIKLTALTEQLSRQINAKNVAVSEYLDTHPELIQDQIILEHLPEIFRKRFSDRINRIPDEYKKAIVAVDLATRIIYSKADNLEHEIKSVL